MKKLPVNGFPYCQYPCHFCRSRDVAVTHLGYFACRGCAKSVTSHEECYEDCKVALKLLVDKNV